MNGIADYEFVKELGAGNHGRFYLARRPSRLPVDADHVAVKVLAGTTGDDAFARATRELRAFAAVRSAYVVRLFDAGQQDGTFYYAMRYHELGSLAHPAQPMPRRHMVAALAAAARAAHDLHEAGLVHRDIKPANVLLTDDGGVLSDLGLAQVLVPGRTMTGMGPVSSIEFIDPSLVRGGRASRASDVWSLGVSLHRALTGTGVYGDLSRADPVLALRTVLTHPPRLADGLPPKAIELLRSCLDPDPQRRPATALQVAEAIEALAQADVGG